MEGKEVSRSYKGPHDCYKCDCEDCECPCHKDVMVMDFAEYDRLRRKVELGDALAKAANAVIDSTGGLHRDDLHVPPSYPSVMSLDEALRAYEAAKGDGDA